MGATQILEFSGITQNQLRKMGLYYGFTSFFDKFYSTL